MNVGPQATGKAGYPDRGVVRTLACSGIVQYGNGVHIINGHTRLLSPAGRCRPPPVRILRAAGRGRQYIKDPYGTTLGISKVKT